MRRVGVSLPGILCLALFGCEVSSRFEHASGFPGKLPSSGVRLAEAFGGLEFRNPLAMEQAGDLVFVAEQRGRIYSSR